MSPEHEDPFIELGITELRALAVLDPKRLLRWLEDSESAFVFGVERFVEHPALWGGRNCLTLNRNVELHFIAGFNEAMERREELPRFSVMADDTRIGITEEFPSNVGDEEGEGGPPLMSLIFYVSASDWADYIEELDEVIADWSASAQPEERTQSFPFLPESLFRQLDVLSFVAERVLRHDIIGAERRFDGRFGYPLTPLGAPEDDEILAPDIDDAEDPEPLHGDELGEVGEVSEEELERLEDEWHEEQRQNEGF